MDTYEFNPSQAYETIYCHWTQWANSVKAKTWVVGISGGKDSTVVAALAARIFGKENVVGVMMPNGTQADIADSEEVCKFLGIKSVTVNIGKAYEELLDEVVFGALRPIGINKASYDTITNMPARLRMTTLYAVAQSVGGIVLNTSNRSENVVAFSTLYGDHSGSYAPIQELTVTEVMELGDWLGVPCHLVHKTPVDGLQPKTDEEKLGVTYADIDNLIRLDRGDEATKAKVVDYYWRGKFKLDIVQIPGPTFPSLPDYFRALTR